MGSALINTHIDKIIHASDHLKSIKYRLLLVDDSIAVQKVIGLVLAEKDFEIRLANNGEEALALIPSFMPDIILADIEMPRMNGYQLCEKIKQDPALSHSPVILLTGAFEPIDEELARHVRADDFIVAPFESQELISKINAALAVSAVAAEEGGEDNFEDEAIGLVETPIEEDLWSTEEISDTLEPASGLAKEESGADTDELIEFAEEAETEAESAVTEEISPPSPKEVRPENETIGLSGVKLLSKDDIRRILEDTFRERISPLLSSIDLKGELLAVMTLSLKISIEKALREVAPKLADRILKEVLEGSLESYAKEIESVISEAVPNLARSVIKRELDRIKTED